MHDRFKSHARQAWKRWLLPDPDIFTVDSCFTRTNRTWTSRRYEPQKYTTRINALQVSTALEIKLVMRIYLRKKIKKNVYAWLQDECDSFVVHRRAAPTTSMGTLPYLFLRQHLDEQPPPLPIYFWSKVYALQKSKYRTYSSRNRIKYKFVHHNKWNFLCWFITLKRRFVMHKCDYCENECDTFAEDRALFSAISATPGWGIMQCKSIVLV